MASLHKLYSRLDFVTFQEDQISNLAAKKKVAAQTADLIESGQVVGAGSGSTSFLVLGEVAARIDSGQLENISMVPTSLEVRWMLNRLRIPCHELSYSCPDWIFDGADQVDPQGNLIKGRGGALLQEKLLFQSSSLRRVLVDESKMVDCLDGAVPVEVVPRAVEVVVPRLEALGAESILVRRGSGKDGPVITEQGNVLLDCSFERISDSLEVDLAAVPGIVESGLFIGYRPQIML